MNRPNNVTTKMDAGGQGTKPDKFVVTTDEPKSDCDETSTGTSADADSDVLTTAICISSKN